ncbi:hypothetical protein BD626DRAFT_619945 [Schizophyllum amplum]|uniref:Uncharacterized protein n=1 Tax=Schizophyllum amplum TaxID=97359 RepID=A0A550BV77_9AGAR|nr:hypothetical protein BD626DRAFT_619945 [Auriculariopsis ampla]
MAAPNPDSFIPFSVFTINGQSIAYMPNDTGDPSLLIAFARDQPAMFASFFPTVDIHALLNRDFTVLIEPDPTVFNANADMSVDDPAASPAPSTAPDDGNSSDEDEAKASISPSKPVDPKLLAEFRATQAALDGHTLDFAQLVRTGQCRLHSSYRDDYLRRAAEDRERVFTWDQRRAVPPRPHTLRGDAYRSFLASQALPPYVPATRIAAGFVPREHPLMSTRPVGTQNVKGGTFMWRLTCNPTSADLAYSTIGTTVVPEVGREYSFDELYPESSFDDVPPPYNSSPLRGDSSVWASSSTAASPLPASQDSNLSFEKK